MCTIKVTGESGNEIATLTSKQHGEIVQALNERAQQLRGIVREGCGHPRLADALRASAEQCERLASLLEA